ncbi:MAG: glycosyltransferase [Candidatus Zixiibacteriota bacterium]
MGTDQKINICHLASGDLWAGAEVQVYNIVSALQKLGEFNISAIILNKGKLADKLHETGVRVSVINENQQGFFDIARQVKQYCRDNSIRLLHTHRYKENILGAMSKKAGAVEFLVQTVHGLPEPFTGLRGLKASFLGAVNRVYTRKYFDRVQAVSSQIKAVMSDVVRPEHIRVVYNSINPDHIRFQRMKPEILRELHIDEGTPVIGTVGRMVPIKGFEILLAAFKSIRDAMPDARLVIVGDGPLESELKAQAKGLGIDDAVIFAGYRNDALDVINSFSIFALSSHNEGIPTVVLEAMALGIPVASTAVGGVPEVITDGDSGLLVSAGDAAGLAKACLKLLRDDKLQEKFQKTGQKVVEDKFTSRAQGKYVQDIYCELLG